VGAIERLLSDTVLRERLTRRAAADVRSYRWDTLVERTAATLEALVPSGPAPAGASRASTV